MSLFKYRHFEYEMIIWAVRWYCKYGISYRDLEEMLAERGITVDHTTLYRWVIYYAPKILDKLKWYWKPTLGYSWRVDETYVKIKGKWVYLYRDLDKCGNTIDFYLSPTRSSDAAKRFLSKAMKSLKHWAQPGVINTDKNPSYTKAIAELKEEGKCSAELEHRQVKYLNNIIESDHGKLKRLIKPTLGFKSMRTAYATIKGFEMRMFKKGRFDIWKYGQGIQGEIRIITDNLLAF
ncbi:MAG: IS6 family transposase [Pseudomonadota bacterium]|jgi:IS6 family transposase